MELITEKNLSSTFLKQNSLILSDVDEYEKNIFDETICDKLNKIKNTEINNITQMQSEKLYFLKIFRYNVKKNGKNLFMINSLISKKEDTIKNEIDTKKNSFITLKKFYQNLKKKLESKNILKMKKKMELITKKKAEVFTETQRERWYRLKLQMKKREKKLKNNLSLRNLKEKKALSLRIEKKRKKYLENLEIYSKRRKLEKKIRKKILKKSKIDYNKLKRKIPLYKKMEKNFKEKENLNIEPIYKKSEGLKSNIKFHEKFINEISEILKVDAKTGTGYSFNRD